MILRIQNKRLLFRRVARSIYTWSPSSSSSYVHIIRYRSVVYRLTLGMYVEKYVITFFCVSSFWFFRYWRKENEIFRCIFEFFGGYSTLIHIHVEIFFLGPFIYYTFSLSVRVLCESFILFASMQRKCMYLLFGRLNLQSHTNTPKSWWMVL